MMVFRWLPMILTALSALGAGPGMARAEIQAGLAASYIRNLFDTSMRAVVAPASLCPHIAQFGRFAAGRTWRLLPSVERARFDEGFCVLALDAVGRLHATYPNLRLELAGVRPAPQEMAIVSSSAFPGNGRSWWPVDWQVAGVDDHFRLADMKLLGVSLGIFLHSLTNLAATAEPDLMPSADRILWAWRQALDRALPPQSGSPPAPE